MERNQRTRVLGRFSGMWHLQVIVRRARHLLSGLLCWVCFQAQAQTPVSPPQPEIVCTFVASKAYAPDSAASATAVPADQRPNPLCKAATQDESHNPRGVIFGNGGEDLVVVVTRSSWDKAIAATGQTSARPRLFINGFAAGTPDNLLSTMRQTDDTVWLRYRLHTNAASRDLWMALYREDRLFTPTALHPALGWDKSPTTTSPEHGPAIQVSTDNRLLTAGMVTFGFMVLLVWLIYGTNVFRDSAPVTDITIKAQSFSLARLQSGVWIFFLCAAGSFMWILLGELPQPDPGLVALMAVSFTTSVASITAEKKLEGRVAVASEGLLKDLVTDWTGAGQLHRIQAVAVNAVLLFVGIETVLRDLTFPHFDAAWLSLLGISGVAQAVGKQALEQAYKAAVPAAQPAAPVPSGRNI